MMPRLDGFRLLGAMRTDKNMQIMPVILLSARAGEESRVEGLQAGAARLSREAVLGARIDSAGQRQPRACSRPQGGNGGPARKRGALPRPGDRKLYRHLPDKSGLDEMLYLLDPDFIPDTNNPSSSWLETCIFANDRPFVLEAINEAIGGKRLFELEHRVRRVDGSVGWTLSRAIPLLDSDGEIVEWFGAATDVTERKRAEEEVLALAARSDQQRRLYETVLSNTPDLVYVFNRNHQFIYANNALLAMWGKTWIQAIGKTCLELGYEPWHADMHNREIDAVVAKPSGARYPSRGRRVDVPMTTYSCRYSARTGSGGVAGTTRDVTDRKKQEVPFNIAPRSCHIAEPGSARSLLLLL